MVASRLVSADFRGWARCPHSSESTATKARSRKGSGAAGRDLPSPPSSRSGNGNDTGLSSLAGRFEPAKVAMVKDERSLRTRQRPVRSGALRGAPSEISASDLTPLPRPPHRTAQREIAGSRTTASHATCNTRTTTRAPRAYKPRVPQSLPCRSPSRPRALTSPVGGPCPQPRRCPRPPPETPQARRLLRPAASPSAPDGRLRLWERS